MYVALSRGREREQIRLLHYFNNDLFAKHLSENLRLEDVHLTMLTEMTKDQWQAEFYE
jgi:hypothetical protein